MDSKLKDRLQKLRNLAERGVGGEKETAERKLSQLLSKNGLTEESLKDDSINYYTFSYTYPYRKNLLLQVIYKVLGAKNSNFYHSKGTRNKIGVYCTHAQKIEIELDYEFYSNCFDQELEIFLAAFIEKQNIFPEDVRYFTDDPKDLTPQEIENYMKRDAYADHINKRTRSQMIENKNPEA